MATVRGSQAGPFSYTRKAVQGVHQRFQVAVKEVRHFFPGLGIGDELQIAFSVGIRQEGFDLPDGGVLFPRAGAFAGLQGRLYPPKEESDKMPPRSPER